jgi:hypothetical protein
LVAKNRLTVHKEFGILFIFSLLRVGAIGVFAAMTEAYPESSNIQTLATVRE